MVLKMTDNNEVCVIWISNQERAVIFLISLLQCLKYRTDQLQDVKKLEKLNAILIRQMVSKDKV